MLSGEISLAIPGVKSIMQKVDAQKAAFLAVPANLRAALDRLGRIRIQVSRNAPVTVEFQEVSQIVEQNLKMTQMQWDTAAERASSLDVLRQTKGLSVSLDTVTIASQLFTSAGYVIANTKKNVAAVEKLGEKYLTAEQRAQLNLATRGSDGKLGSSVFLLAGLAGVWMLMRRR